MLRTPKKRANALSVLELCQKRIPQAESYTFGYGKDKVIHFATEKAESIAAGLGLVLGAIQIQGAPLNSIVKAIPNKKTKGLTVLFNDGWIVFGQPNA